MATDPGTRPQREINRLKAQIKHLQKDKEKSFPDLGRATYLAFSEGRLTDPALVEASNKIRAIDTQVEQANAEIARLQSVIQQMKTMPAPAVGACPSCGAPVTAGLRFCGNCGAPVAAAPPAPPAGQACAQCGAPLTPGSRFCGECGATAATAPAPVVPPPPAPVPAPPPPGDAPAAPAPPSEHGQQADAQPKCPSCGTAVEESGAAFCGECGTKL
jgi:hypothetical protein